MAVAGSASLSGRSRGPTRPSIVIDARCVHRMISGIDRYVLGLLSGIASLDSRPEVPIKVLARPGSMIHETIGSAGYFELVECAWSPWGFRSQANLPRLLRSLGCTVYHAPHVYAPLRGRGFTRIITVHDLIPHVRRFEMARSMKSRIFPLWDQWFRAQCTVADCIITVSEFSKRQLMEVIGVPAEKIVVIHNGVDAPCGTGGGGTGILPVPGLHGQDARATNGWATDVSATDSIRQRFNLRGRIISYIGRHDPYKNLATLVKAFAAARPLIQGEVTLVIGGKRDRRYPQMDEAVASLDAATRERIVFTDYVDEPTRLALLRASDLFVFPSKHEGFGLPPLEAMSLGVPVVAANATSLPEVLGDAALLVEPEDVQAMARAMASVLNDPALGARLRDAGRRQAAKFTWEKCALAHLVTYQK